MIADRLHSRLIEVRATCRVHRGAILDGGVRGLIST
jgi:hypothetical protein